MPRRKRRPGIGGIVTSHHVSMRAASSTMRVMGPISSCVGLNGMLPSRLIRLRGPERRRAERGPASDGLPGVAARAERRSCGDGRAGATTQPPGVRVKSCGLSVNRRQADRRPRQRELRQVRLPDDDCARGRSFTTNLVRRLRLRQSDGAAGRRHVRGVGVSLRAMGMQWTRTARGWSPARSNSCASGSACSSGSHRARRAGPGDRRRSRRRARTICSQVTRRAAMAA